MQIKSYAQKAIDTLNKSGYEAYAVGGCVRNALLGIGISDYDICTNALPEQTISAFSGHTVIPTGLAHGTVTVLVDGFPIEITTYRSEGRYLDHRRPENIEFVSSLKEDLSRRDFTMNALCYDGKGKIIDMFGGQKDIMQRLIRAIGNPAERFEEDALRILRAVRFSSQLGFKIEADTAKAMLECKKLLDFVSAERKLEELKKIVCGKYAFDALMNYRDIIAQIIPQARHSFDYDQNSKHHCYDVWEHTCRALSAIEPDVTLRLTMLYHDLGKPYVRFIGKKGYYHFNGHMIKSAEIAHESLKNLKCDTKTLRYVEKLVRLHDERFEADEYKVKKFISQNGWDFFDDYLKIRYADTSAQSDYQKDGKLENLREISEIAKRLKESEAPLFLSDLAISGSDVAKLGYEGREISEKLSYALELVIKDECKNEKNELIKRLTEE